MSTTTRARTSPATEAWELVRQLWTANIPRMMALFSEYDLGKQQAFALVHLDADQPLAMSELASRMFCDASNITGIADRLEDRGLVERRSAPHDRRVKMLTLTSEGERVRAELLTRMGQPPPALAALSAADQRALRDLLRRALEHA